ncbi:sugar transferase [Arthrobacter sp. Bz4]|uniref:sugar transferase n=1 Tax=Arthrobacter sp. Bz4 TaxID=2171979 RepID=UPI001FAF9ED7|nr:sugar transferase [Arthrobacter sp. Bz4]
MKRYPRKLSAIDAIVVLWATSGALLIRFGLIDDADAAPVTTYAIFTVVISVAWWVMLGAWDSRVPRVLGSGAEEYRRVFAASLWLFGLVAIFSYAFRYDTARGYVGLALPAGVIGLLVARWMVRQALCAERRRGMSSSRVLIVGGSSAADHLITSLRRMPLAGYTPVAAHITGANPSLEINLDVPVVGNAPDVQSVIDALDASRADSVAISAGSNIDPGVLRRLGWALAARETRLILAPALTDVAGPRIHTQPVAGLPLVHVSTPKLTGASRALKRLFDITGSSALLICLSPLLLAVSILVKSSSPGPVFYAQERIGIKGEKFRMYKFRSMIEKADDQLSTLLASQGSSGKPLFKVNDDPRITSVGRVLRKYSLDELPQLINVLRGSMSLVGPRPQRAGEVALYDDDAHRRLYVSPGMSGLWQVSGRSNLSWEESIQLDLYYVENWSLIQDIVILFKTFKAVFASQGAV